MPTTPMRQAVAEWRAIPECIWIEAEGHKCINRDTGFPACGNCADRLAAFDTLLGMVEAADKEAAFLHRTAYDAGGTVEEIEHSSGAAMVLDAMSARLGREGK
jgi:hypothetical protein